MTRVVLLLSFLIASGFHAAGVPTPPALQAQLDLLDSGRLDEGITALRSHLRSSSNDAAAYALLTRAYVALEHWDEAIAAGQKAVTLDARNSGYHAWLARSYGEKAGQSSWISAVSLARKTRAEFELAVELDSHNSDARGDLAEFYIQAPPFLGGGLDKAQAQAERLRAMGDEGAALHVEARIAEDQKNLALAEQQFKAAISARPGGPYAILALASFFERHGRVAELEAAAAQVVKAAKPDDSPVLFDAAALLYHAGRNFAAAAQMLRDYIAAPRHTLDSPLFRAHYLLGCIEEKQGDKKAAATEFRAALSLAAGFEPAQEAMKRLRT